MSSHDKSSYYMPGPSLWPLIASIALFLLAGGFVMQLHEVAAGPAVLIAGFAVFAYLLYGWFGEVIKESVSGLYNKQVDVSFRWSMGWFIFSEVMFFAGFFGALFYVRTFALEWISQAELVWPGFEAAWPTLGPKAAAAGETVQKLGAWGLPAINTLILLISGATLTFAHWGLMKDNRKQTIIGLALTVALGIAFLILQVIEYDHALFNFDSGIYGSLFYMLTGFHGFHVAMGTFSFEAVAWYWHFVDVVWLVLFVFIYWL